MKQESKPIFYELIYRYVRADESGEPASHSCHRMKYKDNVTGIFHITDEFMIQINEADAETLL